MRTSKFNESQIVGILKQAESGLAVSDICRQHGISSATFYRWRLKFSSIDVSLLKRNKALERKNSRLKMMYENAQLDMNILKQEMEKKSLKPSRRKEIAQKAVNIHQIAIQRACRIFQISVTCYNYQPKPSDENELIADWLLFLTNLNSNWGFRLCFSQLRNVHGFEWNHKRVYRIYRELELNLRIPPGKHIKREETGTDPE